MKSPRIGMFLIVTFFVIFLVGVLFGYFLQGSTLIKTETEIDSVRKDIDTIQLEQLLLIQSPEKSCPLISVSLQDSSSDLYRIVNELRGTNPASERFDSIKKEADILSVKSWLLATAIEDKCQKDITTVLEIYSKECELCEEQSEILQLLKKDFNDSLLVYSIDFDTDERIIQTIKSSYNITSTPSIIINGTKYGFLERDELIKLI